MKRLLSASLLCTALLFVVSALPARADSLTFTNATTGSGGAGDITTLGPFGSADLVTCIGTSCPAGKALSFNSLVIAGTSEPGTYTPLFLTETYDSTSKLLKLTGTFNGCPLCGNLPGLTVSTDLVKIQFSTGLTATDSASAFSLNMPSAASITSITVADTLLKDLGLPSNAVATLTALTDTGVTDGNTGGTGGNYVNNVGTLVLTFGTASVPEPTSVLLLATILLGSVIGLKRRAAKRTRA